MTDDRRNAARQFMVEMDIGEEWLEAIDPGSPGWLTDYIRDTIAAYRSGDIDWLLAQSDREVVITQAKEFVDGSTYSGPEAVLDALLDWPQEWENFRIEPTRIFAPNDNQVIIVGIHRGRSLRFELDVEAEITWLFTRRNELMTRWEMFMSVDEAIETANETEVSNGR
jgi:ketosteroid isomerase-like protein